jgi:hypothetical protein
MKIIIITVILLLPVMLISEEWGGLKPKGFWDQWSVNAHVGFTSYFGDLSYHDADVSSKLNYESGPAYGIKLSKHFNKYISISGELAYGTLKGGNNKNISFDTRLAEYSLQANLDIVRLIMLKRSPKFGLEAHAGLGQFFFRSTSYEIKDDSESKYVYESSVPEFVYYYGAGAHYHLVRSFAITLDMTLHHAQNDRLDNLVKNNDFDYYSHLSVGLTYYISSFKTSPLKNKARLAHENQRNL